MSPEKTKILLDTFPTLYKDLDWGFQCKDGWFDLLYALSASIDKLITEPDKTIYTVQQIKSKFSSLRFYMGNSTHAMDSLIFQAEADSKYICEQCGQPGQQRGDKGWIYTACDQHIKE